jgi:hypothetical protein
VRLTGGSRELLIASQVYGRIRTNQDALGENIALGESREPPVENISWTDERWNEYRGVVWYAPKRLARRSLPESK